MGRNGMNKNINKTIYKAFGLNIYSEISLPELPKLNIPEELVNIEVEISNLTTLWSKTPKINHFVADTGFCMFKVPDVAIYLIQGGKRIVVSPMKGSQEDHIRLYLLGTCMGALLMQRKILPLHGSAIAINGKAYAIVGDSGAGKSTLASALLNRGYKLLSDDVIPVSLNKENVPMVTPAYPQQKLWIESLKEFGMESYHFRPIVDRDTKFAIPLDNQFATEKLPLAGVFELKKTKNEEISIEPIQNLQRFHTLFYHTYRNLFIERSGLMGWHFDLSAKIIKKITLYHLCRPISRFTANDLMELILTTINKEAEVV